MEPEPSAKSAQGQLESNSEKYMGLPSVDPKVTFLDAVNSVLAEGGGRGSPFLPKQISGLYVLDSRFGSPSRPSG